MKAVIGVPIEKGQLNLSTALKFYGSAIEFPNNLVFVILYVLPEPQQMKKVEFHHPSSGANTISAFIK